MSRYDGQPHTSGATEGGVLRDEGGRFAPGTRGGPGRTPRIREAHSILRSVATPQRIRAIFERLVASAEAGDGTALRILAPYILGRPRFEPADEFDLGPVRDAGDAFVARARVSEALARGVLEPGEASQILQAITTLERSARVLRGPVGAV